MKKGNAVKQLLFNLLFLLIVSTVSCQNRLSNSTDTKNKYPFETVENAPFDLNIFTLKNGLKLYLVPTKDEPRIRTSIIIKSGSKQDPDHATGLAHYLEHMLFKGTDKLGALDFEKESPILKKIEQLFETHRKTGNAEEKKLIYHKIDSLSYEASKYSVSSEFTDIMKEMGITFLNAFTTLDRTGYINNIPSNQLEKWITLEAERFRNPQFRTFHTELETVYEEMNSIIDNGWRYSLFELLATILPGGKNGYKKPIGSIDHIKNPSLVEIKKYYDTYYVPNNMAIILVGDFDPTYATELIEAKFGSMQRKTLPTEGQLVSRPLPESIEKHIVAPGTESLIMGYKFKGYNSKDAVMMEFVEMMLMNGQAGIFDLNINKAQKAQNVSTFPEWYKDYSVHIISATPKQGQSLEELKDLIIEEIDRLKKGDFPGWLLSAVTNDLKKRYMDLLNSNNGITSILERSYSFEKPLSQVFSKMETFEQITKSDVMHFVEENYNNYVVIYKKEGINEEVQRIKKPTITALSSELENKKSLFRREIEDIKTELIEPQLVDFKKDIERGKLKNGVTLNYVENVSNELFNLRIVFNIGKSDKILGLASEYLKYAVTDTYTAAEIKSEFYKMGCSFSVVTNNYATTIYLNGLAANVEKAITLMDHILSKIEPDEMILTSVCEQQLKKKLDQKKSKSAIKSRAVDYINYGPESTFKTLISEKGLAAIKVEQVVEKIKGLRDLQHEIYFYGPNRMEDVISIFDTNFEKSTALKPLLRKSPRYYKKYRSNSVYLVNYEEATQIDVVFLAKLEDYDPYYIPMTWLFEKYFNDLIFKELRETRGLVYSAYHILNFPYYGDGTYDFSINIETQSDKYLEVIHVTHQLLRDMPINEQNFLDAKKELQEKWQSERIIKYNILYHYERAQNKGIDYDPRKGYFDTFPEITLEDFEKFYKEWIKDNYINLLLVGDLNEVDVGQLNEYGVITNLSQKEIFGD